MKYNLLLNGLIVLSLLMTGEAYLQAAEPFRPAIETVQPQDLPKALADKSWAKDLEKLLPALTNYLAELTTFYPDQNLYFLARDMETPYDLARTLFSDDPKSLSRIKLLNASRTALLDNPGFESYLAQEGITPDALSSRRVILADTGILGTMTEGISGLPKVSSHVDSLIHTHFMLSSHYEIPSTRVFLGAYRPNLSTWPMLGDAVMHEYENYPHYTGPYNHHTLKDGKWVGVPSKTDHRETANGRGERFQFTEESTDFAKTIMAKAKKYGLQTDVRKRFFDIRKQMKVVLDEVVSPSADSSKKIALALEMLEKEGVSGAKYVADIADAAQKKQIKLSNDRFVTFFKNLPKKYLPESDMLLFAPGRVPELAGYESVEHVTSTRFPGEIKPSIAALHPSNRAEVLKLASHANPETALNLILRMGSQEWYGETEVIRKIIHSPAFRDASVQTLAGHYLMSFPTPPEELVEDFALARNEDGTLVNSYFFRKRIAKSPSWMQSDGASRLLIRLSESAETATLAQGILGNGYWANRTEGETVLKNLLSHENTDRSGLANYLFANNRRWKGSSWLQKLCPETEGYSRLFCLEEKWGHRVPCVEAELEPKVQYNKRR